MRKNWLLLTVALLVGVLAFSACDDDDDVSDETPTATEEQMDDVADDGDDMGDDDASVIVTDNILTDSAGNTLYVWDNDEPGLSNCGEGCDACARRPEPKRC